MRINKPNMITKKTWNEFRETGLLWYINTILQVFGWSLILEIEEDGTIRDCYPVRTKFRGFSEDIITKSTKKINQWMIDEGKMLLNEVEDGKDND